MAGKLTFTPQDFEKAAIKYRKELLMLPIIGCQDTLQYMTGRPGIRGEERVGTMTSDAQFAPYDPTRSGDANLHLEWRALNTYHGNVVSLFEPNSAIGTLLGTGAVNGEGLKTTPTALHVLALQAKALSEHLNDAIWSGKRNPNGTTTQDLFDGFDTITDKEITAGNISKEKGNYIKLEDEITAVNAVQIAKEILFKLDPRMRKMDLNMYCSQDFVDKYNEAMRMTSAGIGYYSKYEQNTVEGSAGRLHLIPLFNKADSKFIHITPKANMLVGYDQMGDVEKILIEKHHPYFLSYIADMFFGVQFETLDKRRFMAVELASATQTPATSGEGSAA